MESNASNKIMGIISYVVGVFKGSEEHKITTFFTRQERNLNREIKSAKQNITILENQKEYVKTSSTDAIEDAENNLKNAFSNLDIDRLSSNASMDAYASEYWNNVVQAEKKLEEVKKQYNSQIEEIEKEITHYNEQISKFQSRIKTMQEFK